MPRDVLLSQRAESDLVQIWVYTYRHWGTKQADQYHDVLYTVLRHCTRHPEAGRKRDDLRGGYRSIRAGKHIAFYTVTGTQVIVQRILHGSMDPDSSLES